MQTSLFAPVYPPGFELHEDFLSPEEEARLLAWARGLDVGPYVMRGQASLRQIRPFGPGYGGGRPDPLPFPDALREVRTRAAAKVGLDPESFVQAIASFYPTGAGIGWHRDLPLFGPTILGMSLLSPARMRLRRRDDHAVATDVLLRPRCLYVMGGEARTGWEHHLPGVKADRWSITLRTLRAG